MNRDSTNTTSHEIKDEFLIHDMETLEILMDQARLEIVENLASAHSVAEVAEALDVPRTRLYHHFKLLEETGIIGVFETRRSGAKTEKIYRVSARSFRPSEKFFKDKEPRQQAGAILDTLFAATRSDFLRAVQDREVSLDQDQTNLVALSRRVMHLTPDRAAEFAEQLEALFTAFDSDDTDGTRPYAALAIFHPSSRIHR